MKIKKVIPYEAGFYGASKFPGAAIIFDNDKTITTYHRQDCCESVYADVEAIDDIAYTYDFKEPLAFENVKDFGFRFGNPGMMVSVPCYNIQNGYYDDELIIQYDKEKMLSAETKDEIY